MDLYWWFSNRISLIKKKNESFSSNSRHFEHIYLIIVRSNLLSIHFTSFWKINSLFRFFAYETTSRIQNPIVLRKKKKETIATILIIEYRLQLESKARRKRHRKYLNIIIDRLRSTNRYGVECSRHRRKFRLESVSGVGSWKNDLTATVQQGFRFQSKIIYTSS